MSAEDEEELVNYEEQEDEATAKPQSELRHIPNPSRDRTRAMLNDSALTRGALLDSSRALLRDWYLFRAFVFPASLCCLSVVHIGVKWAHRSDMCGGAAAAAAVYR